MIVNRRAYAFHTASFRNQGHIGVAFTCHYHDRTDLSGDWHQADDDYYLSSSPHHKQVTPTQPHFNQSSLGHIVATKQQQVFSLLSMLNRRQWAISNSSKWENEQHTWMFQLFALKTESSFLHSLNPKQLRLELLWMRLKNKDVCFEIEKNYVLQSTSVRKQIIDNFLLPTGGRCWYIVIVSKSRTSGLDQKSIVARSTLFSLFALSRGGGWNLLDQWCFL